MKEKSCLKYKWGVANKLERLEVVLGVILFMTKEDAYAKVKKLIDVRGLEPHIYSISEYKKLAKITE